MENQEYCFLTQTEVIAGKGVIDCGATHSLGGVPSLEASAALRGAPDIDIACRDIDVASSHGVAHVSECQLACSKRKWVDIDVNFAIDATDDTDSRDSFRAFEAWLDLFEQKCLPLDNLVGIDA